MLPACRISAYQPHPLRVRLPSTLQLFVETLQTTRMTVPAAAERIGVFRRAPRSTPSWPGRLLVRKPLTRPAPTGRTQETAGSLGTVAGAQTGISNHLRLMKASAT